jgi:hypothetical protein
VISIAYFGILYSAVAASLDEPWLLFYSFLIIYTDGKTPWAGDQPFTRATQV